MTRSILDNLSSPADLQQLSTEQLYELAAELRGEIIETVSHTGGHLASNLGSVELTIALNYLFDFKRDRIVWDVGHQAYSHKILTGRRAQFHTLRQYNGISGFPRRDESEYDHFGTAHAGTAIAAALGMAVKRDLAGEDHTVVAVVGDGSLTAGMALEGLNSAGHLDRNMIIILNNNDMSIAPNVGAMSGYINKIMKGRALNKLRQDTELVLKKIPALGPGLINAARTVEHAIKRVFVPGTLFEELGLKYVGPVDGHNIEQLLKELERANQLDGPVLLHINTIKGKGYRIAEENPEKWHGAKTFDIATGEPKTVPGEKPKPPAYTNFFAAALSDAMKKDESIVAVTAAMPGGTGLDQIMDKFNERIFDVGIAEQLAVTFAGGMAAEGYKPVAAIYSTFLMRAYDQVFHDVCLQDLPVVFAMDRAGLVGADGPTHHGLYDISYLRCLPNMVLMAPKDENELNAMLHKALRIPHPVAIRYPRTSGEGVKLTMKPDEIEVGKAELLSQGSDAMIFAYGSMVPAAIRTASAVAEKGFSVGVVNGRFASPIDEELLMEYVRPGARLITMEEGVASGGFGSAIMETLEYKGVSELVDVLRIALPSTIIPHGTRGELLKHTGLDDESLKKKVLGFLKRKSNTATPSK